MFSKRFLLFGLTTVLLILLTTLFGRESSEGRQTTYEIRPTITAPQYRSDAARAIDAYERLMDRYLTLIDRSLHTTQSDMQQLRQQVGDLEKVLLRVERKLDSLNLAQKGEATTGDPDGRLCGQLCLLDNGEGEGERG